MTDISVEELFRNCISGKYLLFFLCFLCFLKGENGLDLFTRASFKFPTGLATATCGLGVKSEGRLLISGTKGYILVTAPWWKTTYFEVHYENPDDIEKYSETYLGDGLRYEINDLLMQLTNRGVNDFKLTRSESIAMSTAMEQFLREK